jgi:hypothetical protein
MERAMKIYGGRRKLEALLLMTTFLLGVIFLPVRTYSVGYDRIGDRGASGDPSDWNPDRIPNPAGTVYDNARLTSSGFVDRMIDRIGSDRSVLQSEAIVNQSGGHIGGFELVGFYLLGMILGGLLGVMITRRTYGRNMQDARPQRLIARWGQRLRRASRSGSPEAEHGKEETPQSFSRPQPEREPRWNARWLKRRTVEAEEFVVRDSTGMRRAKLGMSVDGWVRLHLFDKDGERCVSLGVAPDGDSRLRLYDHHGAPRVGLAVFPDSAGAGLALNDPAGNPRMTFSLLDDGAADLRILDADGTVLRKAP